jgi:hypothetical protein
VLVSKKEFFAVVLEWSSKRQMQADMKDGKEEQYFMCAYFTESSNVNYQLKPTCVEYSENHGSLKLVHNDIQNTSHHQLKTAGFSR